jgi:thioredoxin-like negative regulator of GroEL
VLVARDLPIDRFTMCDRPIAYGVVGNQSGVASVMWIKEAKAAMAKSDYAKALPNLKIMLKSKPDDENNQLNLAKCVINLATKDAEMVEMAETELEELKEEKEKQLQKITKVNFKISEG